MARLIWIFDSRCRHPGPSRSPSALGLTCAPWSWEDRASQLWLLAAKPVCNWCYTPQAVFLCFSRLRLCLLPISASLAAQDFEPGPRAMSVSFSPPRAKLKQTRRQQRLCASLKHKSCSWLKVAASPERVGMERNNGCCSR